MSTIPLFTRKREYHSKTILAFQYTEPIPILAFQYTEPIPILSFQYTEPIPILSFQYTEPIPILHVIPLFPSWRSSIQNPFPSWRSSIQNPFPPCHFTEFGDQVQRMMRGNVATWRRGLSTSRTWLNEVERGGADIGEGDSQSWCVPAADALPLLQIRQVRNWVITGAHRAGEAGDDYVDSEIQTWPQKWRNDVLGLTGVRVRLQGSKDVLLPCESKCFSPSNTKLYAQ